MVLKALTFIILFIFIFTEDFSQDYFSYGGGNFSGINQVIANPAAAADNRLMLDIVVAGLDFNFNNSWFALKRESLKYTNKQFPATWKNNTPNLPDNIFKNFIVIPSQKSHALLLETKLILPSFLLQLNSKNSIAITWQLRQMCNIDGISRQFGYLFEKELDLSVTQNNRVQNKNLSVIQMTWAEYGFTYARVLKQDKEHFIKAGITPKLLQGIEAAYLVVKNLDFLLSTKDTNSYFNTSFSFARSANFKSPINNGKIVNDFYRFVSKPGLGFNLGFIYEWRPDYQKYNTGGVTNTWRKDLNKYKIKFGAAITDIGRIKFKKAGTFYDLDVALKKDNVANYLTVSNYAMLDSLLRDDFSDKTASDEFSILLPTAINTQVDFQLNQLFYLNLSTHIGNFFKNNLYRVHNYSALCFAPRIEHYWFELSLPFTYNVLSAQRFNYLNAGLNLRLGPLSIGSNNVSTLFKGDFSSFNCYALLKWSIPYKRIRDRDQDGLSDKKDICPDLFGELAFEGCPDADGDKIPDYLDSCPHKSGLQQHNGCPDQDGDGISDAEDQCPSEKGRLTTHGCPDSDDDSIADRNDLCPGLKGSAKYQGCPDSDNDSIHDGIDGCPQVPGSFYNKGCPWPDADHDGIPDRLDSCIYVAGLPKFNGCPEPVILVPSEKRVIDKAFSKLEFESGKDVIKAISYPALNELAKLLKVHQTVWKIKLRGHTDNIGTAEKNLILSEKRVRSVRNYLIKKGVSGDDLMLEWFGQNRPIADNATKDGKQKNRRVEMLILSKSKN